MTTYEQTVDSVAGVKGIPAQLWAALAAATGLLLWAYWLVLPGLVTQWWNEDEYSHGFIVPFIAGFIIYHKRETLERLPIRPAYTGLLFLAGAFVIYAVGIIGADLFLQRTSMIIALAGGALFVLGWPMFRELAFPIAYLMLMIPLPGIIFNTIAFPLQLLAAQIATDVMQACAIPVYREGNVIHLAQASLDVEEACSGIRSLISLTAIGVPFAFLMEDSWWRRLLIGLMIVPIAIVANVLRVTVTGLLSHYIDVDTALGLFHSIGGLSVFVMGTLMLFLFTLFMRWTRRFA